MDKELGPELEKDFDTELAASPPRTKEDLLLEDRTPHSFELSQIDPDFSLPASPEGPSAKRSLDKELKLPANEATADPPKPVRKCTHDDFSIGTSYVLESNPSYFGPGQQMEGAKCLGGCGCFLVHTKDQMEALETDGKKGKKLTSKGVYTCCNREDCDECMAAVCLECMDKKQLAMMDDVVGIAGHSRPKHTRVAKVI